MKKFKAFLFSLSIIFIFQACSIFFSDSNFGEGIDVQLGGTVSGISGNVELALIEASSSPSIVEVAKITQNGKYQFEKKINSKKNYLLSYYTSSANLGCVLSHDIIIQPAQDIADANVTCQSAVQLTYNNPATTPHVYTYMNVGKLDLKISGLNATDDIYLVVTNTDSESHYAAAGNKSFFSNVIYPSVVGSSFNGKSTSIQTNVVSSPASQLDSESPPFVREFNERELPRLLAESEKKNPYNILYSSSAIQFATAGTVDSSTRVWKVNKYSSGSEMNNIPTTLRAQGKLSDGKLLKIWVQNDYWGSGDKKIDATKLLPLFKKFCGTGSASLNVQNCAGESIYAKVVDIADAPWGAHSYENLISAASDEIHIVLSQMPNGGGSGTIMGYFYSANNFLTSSVEYSNQALVFFLNAPFYGVEIYRDKDGIPISGDNGTWEISDRNPQEILSTLAHEFQHMIHFYQKKIVNDVQSPTWIDEMSSMVVEDLLATFIGVTNPNGTGPIKKTEQGRLYIYLGNTQCVLDHWYHEPSSECDVLSSYASAYSFGGFLARHFGGKNFVKKLLASKQNNFAAVNEAIGSPANSDAYKTQMARWGASLAMRKKSPPSGYGYIQPEAACTETNTPCLQGINMADYPKTGFKDKSKISEMIFLPNTNTVFNLGTSGYTGIISVPKSIVTVVIDPQ